MLKIFYGIFAQWHQKQPQIHSSCDQEQKMLGCKLLNERSFLSVYWERKVGKEIKITGCNDASQESMTNNWIMKRGGAKV